MATRLSQEATEALGVGNPDALLSQEVAEVLGSGNAGARFSQDATEVLGIGAPNALVSQVVLEVLVNTNPNALVTQAGVEVLSVQNPNALVTQAGVEVIVPNTRFLRAILSYAQLRLPNIFRTIPSSASIGVTARYIPSTGEFRARGRTIIASASLRSNTQRAIFATAEIGYRRYVAAFGRFLGTPSRPIPSYAYFKQPGAIPAKASFWKNSPVYKLVSDAESKVMSLSSHLVGGGVSHDSIGFPHASSAGYPTNWDQPDYDDRFWQPPLVGSNFLVPFDVPDPDVKQLDFNWGWPNPTNDFSGNFSIGYHSLTADPWNDPLLIRRTFGLPSDLVARATSGTVIVGSFGILISEIYVVRMNGVNLPFLSYQVHNPGLTVGIWQIPKTVLRAGNNTLALHVSSYISVAVFGRSGQFRIDLNYTPPQQGLPQVIG